ncbi:ferrous iron transporter B [Alkaliphilus peptidifermentans]|uniref:Ferrous iron transport protein B n=1 Tax=Alkaliphilus peptidifermentans DSM 18978 TaxID=1120976 RepID=A0A1G5L262_9FIRM|nr:ferrous iron transporter B [Alkaliphilus peptidifermentans]SCZ06876.1 ferrous iron transport protein B [Alkaliphilus peptidifermentans DSM 18978]
MSCHTKEPEIHIEEGQIKVLLMGNPNVGKSVVFSKLTGMDVIASNYTGTTVTFTKGNIQHQGNHGVLIDVPGTYSLEATSPAEEVAVNMLDNEKADVIICVLDATNLERNLNFALQLQKYQIPIIFALNLTDVAEQQGISVDIDKLSVELGAPVVPTVAIRNIGLRDILKQAWIMAEKKTVDYGDIPENQDERWQRVGRIIQQVQQVEHRHPTLLEKLGDALIRPLTGIPASIIILALALGIVVGGGKGIRGLILLPLLNNFYVPFITNIVSTFLSEGLIFNVLVGEYGMLIKGIEWPFALILPYVFLFYIVLSFLEDSGYLPRLAVLVDSMLQRIGIQGGNIVPMIMGYGCAVPAILGTRASTSQKERIIVASVVSLAVPCAAQTGAFIALLGDRSVLVLVLVYLISLLAMFIGGMVLNKMIPGKSDPILLEIPNLLMPDRQSYLKKIYLRTKHFMLEAEVPMLLGVGFAALVAETGALNAVGGFIEPIIEGWLGLPREATIGLILGVIRRELAVLPLLELDLSTLQLLVASVVALFYLPCLSVLGVLIKEFRIKIALAIGISTFFLAFFIGGLINQVVTLVSMLL